MSDLTPSISSPAEYVRPIEVTVVKPQRKHYALYGLLLIGTMFTTLVAGARIEFNFLHGAPAFLFNDETFSLFPIRWVLAQPSRLLLGIPFAATLMAILFAHEMGHYIACKHYKVNATLPFFIPFPTFFGTMGAFIRIRSQIRSRAALFDIGIAGPIAGFVVAVAALFISLPFCRAGAQLPDSLTKLGSPLIFDLGLKLIPLHDSNGGIVPLQNIYFHPVAIAAWVGMFATALNLLPGGQLDGGHIIYSLAPRAHRFVSWASIGVLIPLAFYGWTGWLLWAVLLGLTGIRHPSVPEVPAVNGSRRLVALAGLVLLILTFMPAPITHNSLLDVISQLRSGR
jgi:membrane-associated protease RseP (regulator of RpoE activity)